MASETLTVVDNWLPLNLEKAVRFRVFGIKLPTDN